MVHNFVDHNFVNQAELIRQGAQKNRPPCAPLHTIPAGGGRCSMIGGSRIRRRSLSPLSMRWDSAP